jgi:succinate dehydrogenase / fumarate reductase flavoprotein subunit
MQKFNSNVPTGPLENRWEKHKFDLALIAPQNRKKYNVIVIGTGLAGASLCATLGEAGYNVQSFCYNDSPRRAHSIAAQGGVNASKNYQNDGDSTWRLFYDTIRVEILERESPIFIV